MATLLLVLVVVLVIGGLVYGVVSLLSGDDPGLVPAEPDGRARPLPNDRSLHEEDLKEIRFDVALRGYRMTQVDRMLRRVAYDLGYKDEMIAVLEAEVIALREGRLEDAELLRKAREAASTPEAESPRSGWAPASEESVGPGASGPTEAASTQAASTEAASTEAASTEAAPTDAALTDTAPADTALADTALADTAPADTALADEATADVEASAPEAPDNPVAEGAGQEPPTGDRTDRAASLEPDLPREGSLRRREPLPAFSEEPVPAAGEPVPASAAERAADALAGSEGTAAIDMADRPAHA